MHELGDLETTEDTMPTHTTIDHLDDALQRLAKAERVCAAVEAKYLRMADENEKLRARVAELEEHLREGPLVGRLAAARRAIDDATESLAYCENAMFAALTAGGLYEPASVDWSVRDGRNADAVRLLHGAMAAIGAFFDVPESAGTGRGDNGSR